jgi:hypothetical protein
MKRAEGVSRTHNADSVRFNSLVDIAAWTALAAVVFSGLVALLTIVVNAVMKKGDWKHAAELEHGKRVWDTKSGALLDAIRTCERIRAAIRRHEPEGDEALRQAAVWQVYHDCMYSISTPELVAYASSAVNEPIQKLHADMQRASRTDAAVMQYLIDQKVSKLRLQKEKAIEDQNFDLALEIRDAERAANDRHAVGEATGIDVAAVSQWCDAIIAAAREDLRK